MNCLTVEIDEEEESNLLEHAANNDVESFRRSIERDPLAIDEVGLWYGRKKGSNRMVLEHRTPLMVASTYGSLDALKFIVSLPSVDINRASGPDRTTALHCAASGGSYYAVDAVKLLLDAGADPDLIDANGNRAADVVVAPPKLPGVKLALEELLGGSINSTVAVEYRGLPLCVMTTSSISDSPPLSLSPDEEGSPLSNSTSSPPIAKFSDLPRVVVSEKKEYPVDPSLPDIKNSVYASDEFRMFSFKIRPCSRAYSHDWTECPFVHPGENARRRDPRKYHYSCVPCPDFRKGACRRADMCEYAHGVFECWLHPAQYRTRLCKDGSSCSRRVCFFAHTNEELRPLYMSTGSAVPSPRSSSAALEMAAALGLMPGSPSSVSAIMSPFTPPMSPLSNGAGHSTLGWQQSSVPTLNLPANNNQSSRLRSSLSARDMPLEDLSEFDTQQLLNDMNYSGLGSFAGNNSARNKTLTPSNLDEIFSAEIASSPRYNSDQGAFFQPSHRSAILNQLQQQQQHTLLSPIKTSVFSPTADDAQHLSAHSLLQSSRTITSPSLMSPRSMEPVSPLSPRLAMLSQRERQQQTLRSLSSRDLSPILSPTICSSVSSAWSKWAAPSGAADWGVNGEELVRLRRSSSFEMRGNVDEPDLSWVHSLVKESPPEKLVSVAMSPSTSGLPTICGDNSKSINSLIEGCDQAAVLGAWLEQMQLDQALT
ncbi:zinc finger CCCH domain-containing protein 24-like [Zingiber officinale]|uniref:zinc finger CCCH domain-containing protein 24-like n=1 Tax=Zingiber officinale TaxID=94328 RepID=UPI001C4BCC6D|nr:zinc finger CCCH domain-containing protein 24-like [Zingiber officinale]XP_042447725.1 zinc finger CCCH domain-containing protein 24-like [Zingiber officinale]XP_042447726.1 zinc finger CCCH domain-containing protein 24-like [Zingiber officinale]